MEKKTRAMQAEETKNRILEIALAMFEKQNIDEIRVTDICKKAKVSVGAFYHYYPSKNSIIEDTYIKIDQRAVVEAASISCDSETERILKFLNLSMDIMAERGYYFVANVYRFILEGDNPYVLREDRPTTQFILKAVERGIASDEFLSTIDAKSISATIMRTVRGIAFDWSVAEGCYSLKDEVYCVIKNILAAYRAT